MMERGVPRRHESRKGVRKEKGPEGLAIAGWSQSKARRKEKGKGMERTEDGEEGKENNVTFGLFTSGASGPNAV